MVQGGDCARCEASGRVRPARLNGWCDEASKALSLAPDEDAYAPLCRECEFLLEHLRSAERGYGFLDERQRDEHDEQKERFFGAIDSERVVRRREGGGDAPGESTDRTRAVDPPGDRSR